jgi:hypothetical protein
MRHPITSAQVKIIGSEKTQRKIDSLNNVFIREFEREEGNEGVFM